jgi:hypothetical protein
MKPMLLINILQIECEYQCSKVSNIAQIMYCFEAFCLPVAKQKLGSENS